MMVADRHMLITMENITDPEELAQAREEDERFARNSAWLQMHAAEIYTQYRGKCICVAGEELFIANTPEEVLAQARTAHPEEGGSILIISRARKSRALMRLDGQWLVCDDGVRRPVISGEIRAANGSWEKSAFLVDTGADRTVFSAATLARLGLQPVTMHEGLSGVGGMANAMIVDTQIRLTREHAGKVVFRGQYAAVTELEALDIHSGRADQVDSVY